ncbi:MAG: AraC family transcriptional regulator [Gammaproteobacteria bacterium]|nr:MAG: AraC family transcriptional regulator [Gammaproteobacteria bacterium]
MDRDWKDKNSMRLTKTIKTGMENRVRVAVGDARLSPANAAGCIRNPAFNKNETATDSPDRGIKRLIDYFRDNPSERISIEKACQLSGMGRRNLYYQFNKSTGLSPKKYFSRIRLGYLREELICSDQSITQLALKYGFNHLGDFSALYKSVYGELPSATRKTVVESKPVALYKSV